MLPPSPLVTCGVPIGCSEWLRPDVIVPEFGCSTAGCHGDEDKWGDSREGTRLSITDSIGILEWRLGNVGVRLLTGPFN